MAPCKVKIDNILPQEERGHLVFVAEDTKWKMHRSDEICRVYATKTKSINSGDTVAYCNIFGALTKGHVVGTDEDTGKIIIYVGPEQPDPEQIPSMYLAHKKPDELIKTAESKKSVIQAVKEYNK